MVQPIILLDSGVLINLLATQELNSILKLTGVYKICSVVAKQKIYIRSEDSDVSQLDIIDITPFIQSNLLEICQLESEQEETLYIYYASLLDDGEAMSLTMAQTRDYTLATDEPKMRHLFSSEALAPEKLLSTSDIILNWAQQTAILPNKLNSTLKRIKRCANFIPSSNDCNYQWWLANYNNCS